MEIKYSQYAKECEIITYHLVKILVFMIITLNPITVGQILVHIINIIDPNVFLAGLRNFRLKEIEVF